MKKIIIYLIIGLPVFWLACKKENKSDNNDNIASKYTVTTLPGIFTGPLALTADATGNIYVTDASNRIGKISANGSVTYSFSGNGAYAMVDGPSQTASFWTPWGLAFDGQGNIYVADVGNNSIRKVLANGSVTTVSGGGNSNAGYVNGDISIARFNFPHGIAVDASGQIFITDKGNKKVRKISTSGLVSTVANEFEFSDPLAITVDPTGNIFVGDFHLIRKISSNGQVSTVGQPGSYFAPTGLAADKAGNLFFVNRVNNSIYMFSPSGNMTKIAGNGSSEGGYIDGDGNDAQFSSPMSIALDVSGNIYVADFGNNRIRKIFLK